MYVLNLFEAVVSILLLIEHSLESQFLQEYSQFYPSIARSIEIFVFL